MSPASLVAEATASRAIPRSKHGLDLAYETGSAVVTWTKTKYRYPLSPRFFPVSNLLLHESRGCWEDGQRPDPPRRQEQADGIGFINEKKEEELAERFRDLFTIRGGTLTSPVVPQGRDDVAVFDEIVESYRTAGQLVRCIT